MADTRLTNELMRTFDGHEKIGTFKAGEKLTEFGERQNEANEALAANVNSLIKRVCALEDKQEKNNEIMRKIAASLMRSRKSSTESVLTKSLILPLSNALTTL